MLSERPPHVEPVHPNRGFEGWPWKCPHHQGHSPELSQAQAAHVAAGASFTRLVGTPRSVNERLSWTERTVVAQVDSGSSSVPATSRKPSRIRRAFARSMPSQTHAVPA